MPSGAIWNDVLEVGTAEKIFKSRMLNSAFWLNVYEVKTVEHILKIRPLYGAFWWNLKQYFGSWNCWENLESEDAYWHILILFETMLFF